MDENFARNDELLEKKMVAIYLSLPNPLSPFPPLPPFLSTPATEANGTHRKKSLSWIEMLVVEI